MTVGIFFRDPRVQAAMSGPRSAQSAVLVDEFFSAFGYGDCTVAQLLALSDLAARCNTTDVAREALLRVLESGSLEHLARYRLGRILLGEGQPGDAAEQFVLGAQTDESFPHNHMGAARALFVLGAGADASDYAARFIAFGARPHNIEDLTVLGEIADYNFDCGLRERGLPIYQFLYGLGAQQPRHVVRLAEALMGAGDYDEAFRMLRAQTSQSGSDRWSDRALALCYSHFGDHGTAAALALQAVQAEPGNPGFVATYVRALGHARDPTAIRTAMAEHAALLSPTDVAELGIRLNLIENNLAGAVDIVRGAVILPQTRLFQLGVETAYAGLNADQADIAVSLANLLAGIAPESEAVKILRIDTCFRLLLWEDAGEILASMPPSDDDRPQLSMKRLEYASFIGDRQTAAVAVQRMEELAPAASRQLMLPVFRHYAEQQDWDGVIDRVLPWLAGGLNYPQIGYVLFRAAKHSGRQNEMIAAIEAVGGWQENAGLTILRNHLACDLVDTIEDIDRLAVDPAVAGDATLLHKLALRREIMERAARGAKRHAVFFCTDRNYLCATIVALHGAVGAVDLRHTDFYLVADDDIVDLARRTTAAFGESGVSLSIIAASEVTGTAARLPEEYGLFTSGHKLSSAAYYRIFFARYLHQLGVHDRALYMDSDVVLAGPIGNLFHADLGGHPVAARLESIRPEVRRAIAHHGLADGRYFNSGVLLFDLHHADLARSLNASIEAIADENVRLLYHDQCALNLGFRSGFADMDVAWNYPVTEDTVVADVASESCILHFLERPKPWSAAYGGQAGVLWFEKWQEAAAFIGEAAALALFAEISD